jgi:hypothetical protein
LGSKFADIFESVYTAVNSARAKQGGGTLDHGGFNAVLADLGVKKVDWYVALACARKKTPNRWEQMYRNLGKEPLAPRSPKEPEPAPEAEEEPELEPESMTNAEVLATTVDLLQSRETLARMRIFKALKVYFAEE